MRLSQALDLFITASIAARRSDYTIRWYRQYIGRLIAYTQDADLADLTKEQLRAFFAGLSGSVVKWQNHKYRKPVASSLSAATLKGYWQAVRALFNWLEENEYITPQGNIARRLARPKQPKREPKAVTIEDVRAMFEAAKTKGEMCKRDFALLSFFFDTGCRIGGVVSLTLENLYVSERRAMVTEKGDKTRPVFFTARTQKALREWLDCRLSGSNYVFVTETGAKLSEWGMRQIFRRTKKRAGVFGRVNPHSWRHAFSKFYLQNGGDLATLSDLLGHTDVKVTRDTYAVFTVAELQRKYDQHSREEI